MAHDDSTPDHERPDGWGYAARPPAGATGQAEPAPGWAPAWGSPPHQPIAGPPAGWSPGWSRPDTTPRRLPVRPSPVFLALVGAFAASGVLAAKEVGNPRIWVFAFVALGWVISLCLHEFAHAAVAWKGGDRSVEAKGYLTLDPRRYMNSQMSILLPIIVVLIGGIALPGGAVMVDRRRVPDRHMRSLIAAAGPLTNLVFALLCGLPLATGLVKVHSLSLHSGSFPAALAFLALLEVIATVLNLLPIPGFDGFSVLAPYLPQETVAQLMPMARFAWFGLFIVLFYSAAANRAFFGFSYHVLSAIGVDPALGQAGAQLFTFWQRLQ
jgi:Zn-dependent protease